MVEGQRVTPYPWDTGKADSESRGEIKDKALKKAMSYSDRMDPHTVKLMLQALYGDKEKGR